MAKARMFKTKIMCLECIWYMKIYKILWDNHTHNKYIKLQVPMYRSLCKHTHGSTTLAKHNHWKAGNIYKCLFKFIVFSIADW